MDIAAKLLGRLNTPTVQAAFLDLLVEAIDRMPAADRAALVASGADIEIVTASDLEDADKTKIEEAVIGASAAPPS